MNLLVIACLAALATVATVSGAPQSGVLSDHSMGIDSRVVNGHDAVQHAYPWQAALQYRTSSNADLVQHCGASLINERWLLTAAHCKTDLPANTQFQVSAGRHNLNVNEANQQDRAVILWIIHPAHTGGPGSGDIALIKVASAFKFNSVVARIILPWQLIGHSGTAVLAGWGSTSLSGSDVRPSVLQAVTVPIIDNNVCDDALVKLYGKNPIMREISGSSICTGPIDDSRISACTGDAGGPLAKIVDGSWHLIGVVSWTASPCGRVGAPTVYARTSSYRVWIDKQIASN